MEALECGAACLAMIAAYYGKWVPLEQVRADCGVSRDGSKASNVVRAARAYGFEASGFRMQPEALRSQGVFPCIVHWNFSHFVVCRGFKGGKVHLNDPARGEVTVTEAVSYTHLDVYKRQSISCTSFNFTIFYPITA